MSEYSFDRRHWVWVFVMGIGFFATPITNELSLACFWYFSPSLQAICRWFSEHGWPDHSIGRCANSLDICYGPINAASWKGLNIRSESIPTSEKKVQLLLCHSSLGPFKWVFLGFASFFAGRLWENQTIYWNKTYWENLGKTDQCLYPWSDEVFHHSLNTQIPYLNLVIS